MYANTQSSHLTHTAGVREGESIFYPQYLPRFSFRDCLFSSRVKYSNIFQHLSIHPFDHHTTHICIAGTRKLGPLTYMRIIKQIKEVWSWGPGSKIELWNLILKSIIKVGCPSRFKSFISDFLTGRKPLLLWSF